MPKFWKYFGQFVRIQSKQDGFEELFQQVG